MAELNDHRHRAIAENPGRDLARTLGWFSVGLGLAQLVAPRGVNRIAGLDDDAKNRALQRMVGVRELIAGVGILMNPRPSPWLWARVAGDVMDATVLTAALATRDEDRERLTGALAAVLGVAAADLAAAMQLTAAGGSATGTRPADRSIPAERAITVWKPQAEVYAFWRDFAHFPHFMTHLESVEEIGGGRSRWTAKGPAGRSVSWEAEIVEERPNEVISWRSIEGADVWNAGVVEFAPTPDGEGTEVKVHIHYRPPAGVVGMTIARLFGEDPNQSLREDMRRFKQIMEVGEAVHSDASLTESRLRRQRPAQPPETVPPELLAAQAAAAGLSA
jgi:uncharacterized membrane protein